MDCTSQFINGTAVTLNDPYSVILWSTVSYCAEYNSSSGAVINMLCSLVIPGILGSLLMVLSDKMGWKRGVNPPSSYSSSLSKMSALAFKLVIFGILALLGFVRPAASLE